MPTYCVIQLARFGDVLQTGRLLRSLLAESGAAVHLCVDRSLARMAALAFPGVVVHGLRAHGPAGGFDGKAGGARAEGEALLVLENRAVFAALAALRADAVYNLNFSGCNFAVAALFDPAIVRGHRMVSGQPLKDDLTRLAFRWTRERRTSPCNLVDFWAHLASSPIDPTAVNPSAVPRGGGLGVVLAGRNSRRSLPPEVLAVCVQAALERLGRARAPRIALLGTEAERPFARELLDVLPLALRDRVDNMAGKTGWEELFALVGGLDVLLTPDTGTMHLAAHLGTPVEAFFLASAWAWETGPYGVGHRVWQAVTDCAPCLENQSCPCDAACLAPFRSREFLRLVTGRQGDFPAGMVGLDSVHDALGATYTAAYGVDPVATARAARRAVLAEWLGLALPDAPRDNGEAADALFQDRDWMFPPDNHQPEECC